MMARVDRTAGESESYSMDQWPGYESNRRRLLKFFAERKIANPVVLTGDIHSNWANDLLVDFDDLDGRAVARRVRRHVDLLRRRRHANPSRPATPMLAENPFVKFHNAERGYVRCHVTPKAWKTDFQIVEYVTRPGAPINTAASFVLEAGRAASSALVPSRSA